MVDGGIHVEGVWAEVSVDVVAAGNRAGRGGDDAPVGERECGGEEERPREGVEGGAAKWDEAEHENKLQITKDKLQITNYKLQRTKGIKGHKKTER